jgi:hypothetical protein
MGKYRVIKNPREEDWNLFFEGFASGNLQESFEYGEVIKRSNPNTGVIRLMALDATNPVGIVQARYRRKFGFGEALEVGGLYGYGPIVADIKEKEEIYVELMTTLEKLAIRKRILNGLIYQTERNLTLEKMGYVIVDIFNIYRVKLSGNIEEVWRRMEHNKRRNIKKAEEQGVKVIEGSSYDHLISFYEMLKITEKRAGFKSHSFDFFNSCLKIFGAKDKVKIFLAKKDDKPIAGVFILIYADTAYALAAGSLSEAWHFRPNDILHWKAMEWACTNGLSYYHLGSVSEPPPHENSPRWGLWRWKREWNGQLNKVFVYEKIYMPRLRRLALAGAQMLHPVLHKNIYSFRAEEPSKEKM